MTSLIKPPSYQSANQRHRQKLLFLVFWIVGMSSSLVKDQSAFGWFQIINDDDKWCKPHIPSPTQYASFGCYGCLDAILASQVGGVAADRWTKFKGFQGTVTKRSSITTISSMNNQSHIKRVHDIFFFKIAWFQSWINFQSSWGQIVEVYYRKMH